jgi:hypothetical protein
MEIIGLAIVLIAVMHYMSSPKKEKKDEKKGEKK